MRKLLNRFALWVIKKGHQLYKPTVGKEIDRALDGYEGWSVRTHWTGLQNRFGVGVIGKNPTSGNPTRNMVTVVGVSSHEEALAAALPHLVKWVEEVGVAK